MYVFTSAHCPEWLQIPPDYLSINSIYKTDKTHVTLACVHNSCEQHNIVVKKYKKDHTKRADFAKEVELHGSLDHPNIVKLYGAWETAKHFCLAVQHAAGGDLFDMMYTQNIDMSFDAMVNTVAFPLLKALEYLHQHDIAHMDIKPENMGFDARGRLLLMDFGLATRCISTSHHTHNMHVFTKGYGAPELLSKQKEIHPKAIDIWCVGLLMFEVHEKKSPDVWLETRRAKCKRLCKVVKMCTKTNPTDRPTIDELLQHIVN